MNVISDFLNKFLKFEKDNDTKLLLILEIIKKETGLELKREMLQIKGDNLRINCSPVFRNEIFMHQSQIEKGLKSQKIFLVLV